MEGRDYFLSGATSKHIYSVIFSRHTVSLSDRNLLSGFLSGTLETMEIKHLCCSHIIWQYIRHILMHMNF